jgi:threonine/homoserine/homoserine lactone efflux protein
MTEAIIKGLGLGLILMLSVGPVIFAIIKQSINNGQQGGFSFVAGVWLSDLILVVLSNMFTEVVGRILHFSNEIAYGGGGFLMMMGIYYVFFKKVDFGRDDLSNLPPFNRKDAIRTVTAGFLVNTLNPSIFLFWLINATALAVTHDITERIVIFSICIVVNILSDIAKVMMAGRLREKLTMHNIRIINKVSGTILILFGIALFYGVMSGNKPLIGH